MTGRFGGPTVRRSPAPRVRVLHVAQDHVLLLHLGPRQGGDNRCEMAMLTVTAV